MNRIANAMVIAIATGSLAFPSAHDAWAATNPGVAFGRMGAQPQALARAPGSGLTPFASQQTTVTTDGDWYREPPPEGRFGHAAVYDSLRNRMLLLGGNDGFGNYYNDVWELTLGGPPMWRNLTPGGSSPNARMHHSAIYDPVRDRVVIYGGTSLGPDVNDVWALSLAGKPSWVQLFPAGTPPSGRFGHTAIYDPIGDRMLVFGGFSGAYSNEVWALSLAGSPTWTKLTPVGQAPSGRCYHTAIYDPIHTRMVVFAGESGAGLRNDVWVLSLGASTGWTQLAPTLTPPTPRRLHAAIYDPIRDRMIAYAGFSAADDLNDVWALLLSGSPKWIRILDAGVQPHSRYGHSAIYDSADDGMVIYGGSSVFAGLRLSDARALSFPDGTTWNDLTPPTQAPPNGRAFHSAIFDPVRNRMVGFGGTRSGGFALNDVFTLSMAIGPTWSALIPTGTPPSVRWDHTAIYDPVRDRMIVFGGTGDSNNRNAEVWALSFVSVPSWTQLSPAGIPPSPRRSHSAVYDAARDRMIVFGGFADNSDVNEVWSLSLSGTPMWQHLTPTGTPPTGRERHTAIYDPAGDRMVVFGGYSDACSCSSNEVWTLSLAGGTAWTQVSAGGLPPSPRFRHSAAFDIVRDRMIVYGGSDQPNQLWALAFSSSPRWVLLTPAGAPPVGRWCHTAIHDPVSDRMLLFGGIATASPYNYLGDAWELRWTPTVDVPPNAGESRALLVRPHPNPSRGVVTVEYAVPHPGRVSLRIYDLAGRLVRTLVDGAKREGIQTVLWDRGWSSGALAQPGVYFCELRAGGQREARKVLLIR